MSGSEYSIDLPPPRRPDRRRGGGGPWWLVATVVALICGVAAGVWLGKRFVDSGPGRTASLAPEVERSLAKAESAAAEGEWLRARELYRSVLQQAPDHPGASASLRLVESHLRQATGHIVVTSRPEGAKVSVPGREPLLTPAEIRELPVGEIGLRVEMEGFLPVEKTVSVLEKQVTEVPLIPLRRTQGELEVVSEPRGAEFKVLKVSPSDPEDWSELVGVGTTPARLQELEAGEYQVRMAVEGWPDYSQRIQVLHNRSTSVSAVFASGGVNIVSDPPGAEVWSAPSGGVLSRRGVTPMTLRDLAPGRHQVELRHGDWVPIRRTVDVRGNATQHLDFTWERSMVTFRSDPPGAAVYRDNRRVGREITPFSAEFPEGEYVFEARINGLESRFRPVYIEGEEGTSVEFGFAYGSVSIDSVPPGAAVVANGIPVGRTPLRKEVVGPGTYEYAISREGYKTSTVSHAVEAGGRLEFTARLVPDQIPAVNRSFTNGLGQRMIWFGNLGGWVADTETLQSAYERITGVNPSDFPDPRRPVDSVNWYEATRFCEQLTLFERALGNVPEGFVYRLPTDEEWSTFAGDASLTGAVTGAYQRQLSSQPAGTAPPNQFGLYDIRGNVAEWVQDWYSQRILNQLTEEGAFGRQEWVGTDRKVLRGGSWIRTSAVDLELSYRRGARPSQEEMNDVGFRVVLMPE